MSASPKSAELKRVAEQIFRKVLAAVDVCAAMDRKLERRGGLLNVDCGACEVNLSEYKGIIAIAFGKAAFGMAKALNKILAPDYLCEGILVVPEGTPAELGGWRSFAAGHPTPSAGTFAAGRAILERLAKCDERSLVIFLLSGGGSSLVEWPLDIAVTLEDFQQLNRVLVGCGAPIEEINAVRKHFSAIKGGRLAAAAPRSTKITLAVSDVPPGNESALASGPTVPDPTTLAEVNNMVERYGLMERLPERLRAALVAHALPETPKAQAKEFARSTFVRVLDSHDLTHAAHHTCEAAGFVCVCDRSTDGWSLEKAADHLLGILRQQKRDNPGRHVAVIADGEVSSPVNGDGVGGRNSAFALTCVPKIAGQKIAVLSAGTDGIDGNSPAAGAAADGETLARAKEQHMQYADHLERSDAYSFFETLGDTVRTGPTGNNLRDLRVLLSEAE